jgi:enoyl-CoA hydratase/carnithine racemase
LSETHNASLRLERRDGVATITLDRPKVQNALTPALFVQLGELFGEVAENPDDRVLVLTGAGNAFCAGADLADPEAAAAMANHGPVSLGQFVRRSTAAALPLHRLPKPTIAAVNGVAAGGGCNLALGCDIVFAGQSARFSEIFVKRGLGIDYGGSWLLPRLVGLQRAKDIAFRGDVLGADEAERYGLVLEVVPDAELMERVGDYARTLASRPPIALAAIKSGINRGAAWSYEESLEFEADSQATCLGSEDFREAMRAWFKKQDGVYQGR